MNWEARELYLEVREDGQGHKRVPLKGTLKLSAIKNT